MPEEVEFDNSKTQEKHPEPTGLESHEVSLVAFGDVAREAVNYYRREKQLTPELLKELQERKLKSLATETRERVGDSVNKISDAVELFRDSMDSNRLQAARFLKKAEDDQNYTKTQREDYRREAEMLAANNEKIEKGFELMKEVATRETWFDAEGGAEVDPYTGLHTKEAFMQRASRELNKINTLAKSDKSEDRQETIKLVKRLRNIEVQVGDMTNFKQGNDILGHNEFDILLQRDFAARFIAVAAYLGSNEYAGDVDMEAINNHFPEGSEERNRLDAAKGNLTVDLYKMKISGSDEIMIATEYLDENISDDKRDSLRNLAGELVNDVFSSVVIGRHKNTEELKLMGEAFENSAGPLSVGVKKEGEKVIVGEIESYAYKKFGDALRFYFQDKNFGEKMANDSSCFVRLGADMSDHHNLGEGLSMLLHGVDFKGNNVQTSRNGRLVTGDGNLNKETMPQFTERVHSSVVRRVSSVGVSSEAEMEELIQRATANEVIGALLENAEKESEDISKPEGKRRLLARAWMRTGKMPDEDTYALGSLMTAGRMRAEMADPEKAREVYEEVHQHYLKMMLEEVAKVPTILKKYTWGSREDALKAAVQAGDLDGPLLRFYAKYYEDLGSLKFIYSDKINTLSEEDTKKAKETYLPELPDLPAGLRLKDLNVPLR